MNRLGISHEQLHHAYLIVGAREGVVPVLEEFVTSDLQMSIMSNPDVTFTHYDSLGIDEARGIKKTHLLKSFDASGRRVTVLSVGSVTVEAQNSLLKLFEEPAAGTHFFLIVSSAGGILPTLRSRMVQIALTDENGKVQNATAASSLAGGKYADKVEKFCAPPPTGSLKTRLDIAAALAKDLTDETATKADIKDFVAAVITHISKIPTTTKNFSPESRSRILTTLLETNDYINDRGASTKLLLENIAITLYT